jgi:hypothetical protein
VFHFKQTNAFQPVQEDALADPSKPVTPAAASMPAGQDSIAASSAGWLGAGLVVIGLVAFIVTIAITSSATATSLGFAAISGIALLSVTLVGIIVLTRAVGMADATQALALPQGSVRALLAFILAIVFVAVASWTLGGLFDPTGPLVAKDVAAPADVDEFLKPYQSDQYIIFKSAGPDKDSKSTAAVYLRREAPQKEVVDLAKQIVTISATVLVTIVGFYFGSKSSSDAVKSANDGLVAMRKAMSDASDDADPTEAASADDIAKAASAAGAIAAATAAKLQVLGNAPLDDLKQAVQQGKGGDVAKAALADAEASFATLTDRAKLCQDSGSKAAQLAAGAGALDQSGLNGARDKLKELLDAAVKANHEFEQAYAAFAAAKAKGLGAAGQ